MYKPKCNCGAFTINKARQIGIINAPNWLVERHSFKCPAKSYERLVDRMQHLNQQPMHKTILRYPNYANH